eukprot:CAMPEP_0174725764 /NCGR_PEP_ID=MMETSP1094-20130205/46365_1 /TAXON_ID=156173 /ORGANISM="Chrysochromulina brevifilum, Strain UTEX LB 985" /LENGTH=139 /DNA_ID=CAMNT_0015927239 /DNA_START=205 /DNA_END=622 /DNA_ORIENTATION=+
MGRHFTSAAAKQPAVNRPGHALPRPDGSASPSATRPASCPGQVSLRPTAGVGDTLGQCGGEPGGREQCGAEAGQEAAAARAAATDQDGDPGNHAHLHEGEESESTQPPNPSLVTPGTNACAPGLLRAQLSQRQLPAAAV